PRRPGGTQRERRLPQPAAPRQRRDGRRMARGAADAEAQRRAEGPALGAPAFAERSRFRREALAAARLDHPGLCAVYEVGETDGTPFLAMRHEPGCTLGEHV